MIVVFDGNYLYEPIAGTVDYLSYWDEVPEAIIIGINQSEKENSDFQIGFETNLPKGSGGDFFDFIEIELIPTLEEKYRIADFRMAVGHSQSANFINFFLLRKSLLFNGYVSLSPFLSTNMSNRVINALKTKETKLFYYLANGEKDFKSVTKKVKPLGDKLMKIENPKTEIFYDQIKKQRIILWPADPFLKP